MCWCMCLSHPDEVGTTTALSGLSQNSIHKTVSEKMLPLGCWNREIGSYHIRYPSFRGDGRDWIFRALLGCFGLFFVSVVVFWASINFLLMWRKSLSSLPFLAMNLFYVLPWQVRHLILFTIFFKHVHGQGDPFHYCQSLVYFINSALWVSNGDTIVFLAGIQIKPM